MRRYIRNSQCPVRFFFQQCSVRFFSLHYNQTHFDDIVLQTSINFSIEQQIIWWTNPNKIHFKIIDMCFGCLLKCVLFVEQTVKHHLPFLDWFFYIRIDFIDGYKVTGTQWLGKNEIFRIEDDSEQNENVLYRINVHWITFFIFMSKKKSQKTVTRSMQTHHHFSATFLIIVFHRAQPPCKKMTRIYQAAICFPIML